MTNKSENCTTEEISTIWFELIKKYNKNAVISRNLFQNILTHYNSQIRHYHNIMHICKMLKSAEKFRKTANYSDRLIFAIFYHDIIYNPLKSDNEEKSATLAEKELQKINFSDSKIVSEMIIRTKNHFSRAENESPELQLLLDLDLETLGSESEIYFINTQNIRKEYHIYPDLIFNKGRTTVLKKFLESESIYRTPFFKENYENQARINITEELKRLAFDF
jgi:predicted metal-dependent HD superfamily phosphohydrolase